MSNEKNIPKPPTGFIRYRPADPFPTAKSVSESETEQEEIFIPITQEDPPLHRPPDREFPQNMESSQEIPLLPPEPENPSENISEKNCDHTSLHVKAAPPKQNIPKPRPQHQQISPPTVVEIGPRFQSYFSLIFFCFLLGSIIASGFILYNIIQPVTENTSPPR